jgi:hypothetical protein
MRIAFVYTRPDLSSSIVRGQQVATALSAAHFPYALDACLAQDVLVYVKLPPSREDMAQLARAGKIQILDVLDNYNLPSLMKRREYLNGLIAASLTHQAFLAQHFSVPVQAIPHHHANFNQVRISIKPAPPLTLGYVGHQDHWPVNRFITGLGSPVITDFEFHNLEQTFQCIDIGVALRNDRAKTQFNSSLKLLNFMSFGIPSVLSPELSYLEVARHGEECLYAQDEKDCRTMLRHLAGNFELRRKISARAFARARNFHISRIAAHYKDYLKQFSTR